jgi:hypothetical protein
MPCEFWHDPAMKTGSDRISVDDAILPSDTDPKEDVLSWQKSQIEKRKKLADEGRFASSDAVKTVIRKFIPNG